MACDDSSALKRRKSVSSRAADAVSPRPRYAQHRGVVHLHVLGIHRGRPASAPPRPAAYWRFRKRMRAIWLSTTRSRGYCCADALERLQGAVVIAVGLLDRRPGRTRCGPARGLISSALAMYGLAASVSPSWISARATFSQPSAYPGSASVTLLERVFGAFQVALQQQADAPIVPALAILFAHHRASRWAAPSGIGRFGLRQGDDRQVGDAAANVAGDVGRNSRRVEIVLAGRCDRRQAAPGPGRASATPA